MHRGRNPTEVPPVKWDEIKPEEKVNLAINMSSVVIRICIDSIRDQHPNWSERTIIKEARRRLTYGRTPHYEV